jgi:hypothetical protein
MNVRDRLFVRVSLLVMKLLPEPLDVIFIGLLTRILYKNLP